MRHSPRRGDLRAEVASTTEIRSSWATYQRRNPSTADLRGNVAPVTCRHYHLLDLIDSEERFTFPIVDTPAPPPPRGSAQCSYWSCFARPIRPYSLSRAPDSLYNTGARASEAARFTVADLVPDNLSVRLDGKGRKIRTCPLWPRTVEVLRELLGPRIDGPREAPIFLNVHGRPITRYGIHDLVVRIANKAAETVPSLRDKRVSPHTVRHATAVHLLRAGVDINTIRAWLGHVSLETTNRYAEVDLEMKAKALQTCADDGLESVHGCTPSWHSDSELMAFLASL